MGPFLLVLVVLGMGILALIPLGSALNPKWSEESLAKYAHLFARFPLLWLLFLIMALAMAYTTEDLPSAQVILYGGGSVFLGGMAAWIAYQNQNNRQTWFVVGLALLVATIYWAIQLPYTRVWAGFALLIPAIAAYIAQDKVEGGLKIPFWLIIAAMVLAALRVWFLP